MFIRVLEYARQVMHNHSTAAAIFRQSYVHYTVHSYASETFLEDIDSSCPYLDDLSSACSPCPGETGHVLDFKGLTYHCRIKTRSKDNPPLGLGTPYTLLILRNLLSEYLKTFVYD